jgi:hypothetical protein
LEKPLSFSCTLDDMAFALNFLPHLPGKARMVGALSLIQEDFLTPEAPPPPWPSPINMGRGIKSKRWISVLTGILETLFFKVLN